MKHKTGIEWKFNIKEELAFTNVNQIVYEHLNNLGFDISKKSTVEGQMLFLKLAFDQEESLKKLLEMSPLAVTPDLKPDAPPPTDKSLVRKSLQKDLFKSPTSGQTVSGTPSSTLHF